MGARPGYRQTVEHVRSRMRSRLATLAAKPKLVSREWLAREYWERKRNCVAIGLELGRDPKTIHSWMRHYGIPTRPRGAASSPCAFLPGHRSPFTGRRHTPEAREKFRALRLADGHVPYLRNGVHWLKGAPKGTHPTWKGGITPERQAFYATPEWRQAALAVYVRTRNRCERCDAKRTRERPMHIHHVIGFADVARRADPSNLMLLCKPCHLWVHSRANREREFIG